MNEVLLLNALADALAAASTVLRQHALKFDEPVDATSPSSDTPADVVARARIMHASLGVRQAQIIELLAGAHPDPTDTGTLSRRMGYDQPNVYLTLKGLIAQGLVEKDAAVHPHQYRLSLALYGRE